MAIAIALPEINNPWTFGDPYFTFEKQILFAIIFTLPKINKK